MRIVLGLSSRLPNNLPTINQHLLEAQVVIGGAVQAI